MSRVSALELREPLSASHVGSDTLSNHIILYAPTKLRHDAWSSGPAVVVGKLFEISDRMKISSALKYRAELEEEPLQVQPPEPGQVVLDTADRIENE